MDDEFNISFAHLRFVLRNYMSYETIYHAQMWCGGNKADEQKRGFSSSAIWKRESADSPTSSYIVEAQHQETSERECHR